MNRGLTVRMPSPALLTSRSMPPRRDHTWPAARATDASSLASAASPAAPGHPAAAAAARSADRLVITTVAPAPASAPAMARPRPLVPPVTSARTPSSSLLFAWLEAITCPVSTRGPVRPFIPGARDLRLMGPGLSAP